jgi:hypothetical protein
MQNENLQHPPTPGAGFSVQFLLDCVDDTRLSTIEQCLEIDEI